MEKKINKNKSELHNLIGGKRLKFLANLIETLPLGVIVQNLNHEIKLANPAAAKIHGYSTIEITSNAFSCLRLVSSSNQEELLKVLKQAKTGKSFSNFQFIGLRKDGTEFFEEANGSLVKDNQGIPAAIFITCRDISKQKQVDEAEQKERALSDALINSAALLGSTLDQDEVLDRILEMVGNVVPHDSANIMLIDGDMVRVVRARDYKSPELHEFTMSVQTKVKDMPSMVKIINQQKSLIISDTHTYPGWHTRGGFSWIASYLGAPLKVKGKVIGVINLDSGTTDYFKEEDAVRLQAFADLSAIAIENATLYQSLEIQANESTALFKASTALLNTTSDIGNLAEQIVQYVHNEFSGAHCALLLIDKPHGFLNLIASSGYPIDEILPVNINDNLGITASAVNKKTPIYAPDVSYFPEYYMASLLTRSEFAIPLIVADEVIGALNIESTELDGFDERSRRILITYAERAAIALDNAKLFKDLQTRDKEVTLFNKITHTSLETSNLQEMLEIQASLLLETFIPDGVLFWFSDPFLRKFVNGYAISPDPDSNLILKNLVDDHEFNIELANLMNTQVSRDQPNSGLSNSKLNNLFKSYILRSLDANNVHMGSVVIGYFQEQVFNQNDVAFFDQAARQIALATSKNLSYAAAIEHAREAESLREATSILTSTLNLQEIFEKILFTAIKAIPSAQKGVLLLLSEEKDVFGIKAQFGYADKNILSVAIGRHEGMVGQAVSEKKAFRYNQISPDRKEFTRIHNIEASQQNSWLVAPLILQKDAIGVIELSAEEKAVFTEHDLKVLVSIADTVASAIHNAQLHSEVRNISLTDTLTKLHNRRAFEEFGLREIQRNIRTGAALSMLLMDVDFLKKTNDQHGHTAGDLVLQEIAVICQKTFRQIDLVSRYGGDEFAILLPDTSLNNAMEVAERLRMAISSQKLDFQGIEIPLSASIGVAEYEKEIPSIKEFFDRADKALYKAKENGRNTIAVWEKDKTVGQPKKHNLH